MSKTFFLDRQVEQELFREIISHKTEGNVLFVSGQAGMGKTTLLYVFLQICVEANIKTAVFDFRSGSGGLAELLSRLCYTFGNERFPSFYKQVNLLSFQQTRVDDNVLLGSGEIQLALSGLSPEKRHENQQLLTDAFFYDLVNLIENQTIAMFFDAFESAESELANWFTNIFLSHVSKLKNVIVVVAGRQLPQINPEWQDSLTTIQLAPISEEHWFAYAQKLGLSVSKDFISGVTVGLKGHPLSMAMFLQLSAQERGEK